MEIHCLRAARPLARMPRSASEKAARALRPRFGLAGAAIRALAHIFEEFKKPDEPPPARGRSRKPRRIIQQRHQKKHQITTMKMHPIRLASLLLTAFAISTKAATYDATADFSATANPNGVWSSGWTSAALEPNYAFSLFDTPFGSNNPGGTLDKWTASSVHPEVPTFAKNTQTDAFGIMVGELVLHGGFEGQFAILRFTAPQPGSFTLRGEFRDTDYGVADARIILNRDSASPLYSSGGIIGTQPYSYSLNLTLAEGDTVSRRGSSTAAPLAIPWPLRRCLRPCPSREGSPSGSGSCLERSRFAGGARG